VINLIKIMGIIAELQREYGPHVILAELSERINKLADKKERDWREFPMVGAKLCECGKWIIFVQTKNKMQMPVDPDTGLSHFATCKHADKFRRKGRASE